jgi:tetratricopeptide (TPR) repeat protein
MSPRVAAWFVLLLCAGGHRAAADPVIPANDGVVLATIPRPQGLGSDQIRRLRRSLERNPGDDAAAARLAQIYADVNSSSGEPRYLGYATAILAPWDNVVSPPAEIWLVRARVAQRLHRFGEAQADLEAFLREHPGNPEAALLLSTVGLVRGDYDSAHTACKHLAEHHQSALASICIANLSPYLGRMDVGARDLDALIHTGTLRGDLATWVLTTAAELAVGRGASAEADRYYQDAVAAMTRGGAPDLYLLGSYADFLIDQGQSEMALEVLETAPATDSVLIRRALAEPDENSRREVVELLRNRMAVLVRRNDDAHARELAWSHLSIFVEAQSGLRYAQRNWELQHEMRDARLLLEAALAADDPGAARPVVDWVEAHGIRHAWLDGLIDQWRQASSQ